jgi:hypothetical protein
MKSTKSFVLLLTGIVLLSISNSAFAQTRVVKVNAIKVNDFGVQYMLPKTQLEITVEYTQTIQKAGQYARFASRYLGINEPDVVLEDQTFYTLDRVFVTEKGIPDKEQSFLVSFRARTTSPFVYLTEDGIICAINTEYVPEKENVIPVNLQPQSELPRINPQSLFTEEYLRAGSVTRMAEVAAKNIYKIRESRQDILTGEVDNMPKDGEALRIVLGNLEAQEKIWTELFTGTTQANKQTKRIVINPVEELNNEVLFRFSKYLGVMDADDLSGSPVYMNLRNLRTVEIPAEDPKRKAREPESIVYNVPGKAELEIFNGINKIYSTTVNVTQFGTTQILATSLFDDRKTPVQIVFYPTTGGIKSINQ